MGQYRQWLSYREADQQLQHQIKESEQELVQLYAQIDQLEADTSYSENIILQMLIGIQQAEKARRHKAEAPVPAPSMFGEQSASDNGRGSVSPALFGWGNLPNFDTQDIQRPITDAPNQHLAPQFQSSKDDLLPQDLSAFTEDSSQTDPQIKIPWWLRDTPPAAAQEDQQSTQPIDQLSQRTNQYVQRWFERWGKSANESEPAQEKPRP